MLRAAKSLGDLFNANRGKVMRTGYCWVARNNESSGVCMCAFVCVPVSVFEWKQMETQQKYWFGVQYLPYYSILHHALGFTLYK